MKTFDPDLYLVQHIIDRSRDLSRSIDLLTEFLTDEQFEKGREGFLNVGLDLLSEDRHETWRFICSRPEVFLPIINSLGGKVDGLHLDETVFYRKENPWSRED